MKKINQILLICILVLTAVLAAAVVFRAYYVYDTDRRLAAEQEEAEAARVYERNQEAAARVSEMQMEIQELARDREALRQFIGSLETEENAEAGQGEAAAESDAVSGDDVTVDGNAAPGNEAAVPVINADSAEISGNGAMSGDSVSDDDAVSGNGVSGNDAVSGNSVSGNDAVSGNGVSDNDAVSDNSVSGDSVSGNTAERYMTLAERRKLRTSLEETLLVNEADRALIADCRIDFSGKKIACLGDSITAAANLEKEENYQQYSYPSQLKDVLGAEEVYNLGIGGSSIGRYWLEAYVDRYEEIPKDTDIIIVMGGTNDGFCASEKELGTLEERAPRTFCGDLDELMRGLRENYPDAAVFFATPLPNILQDYLMSERDYLLPQQRFVDVILALAKEYDYQVVDLYNSNILDSHDVDVVEEYMPDGVHGSHEGYRILAEHFAAELIRYFDPEAGSVSGNGAGFGHDALSDNDTVSADMAG